MFLIDDLIFRPFMSILDALHAYAVNELYDIGAIHDEIKENRLLYELGERSEAEYRERREELEAELAVAEMAHEQIQNKTIEVRT